MSRSVLLRLISRALGRRDLIWFGTRGDDIHGVLDLPNLSASFSVINTYTGSASVRGTSLERHSGLRVDLDAHDIDDDLGTHPYSALRRELLDALSVPSALFAYRPSTLVSSAAFTRPDALYLGMFKDHQSAFEHKPWVESAVARLGIPCVPWTYVPEEDVAQVRRMVDRGPVVVRRSRSSGGAGISKVTGDDDLAVELSGMADGIVSVAPYLADTVPVNVGGVVWRDGVTVHLPSVQVIGHPQLTSRPFGYCGNDFGLVEQLGAAVVAQIELSTNEVGAWLGRSGYRGAFGMDFLVTDGEPLFIEVNPRFQGSTHLSTLLSREADEGCLLSEHLASYLGLDAPAQAPLFDRVRAARPAAHVVQHWLSPAATSLDITGVARDMESVAGFVHSDVLLPPRTACASGATIGRYTFRRSVTTTGFDLAADVGSVLRQPQERSVPATTEVLA